MPRARSHRLLKWLTVAAALLVVSAVGSLWWGGNSFSDSAVGITLEATDRVTSGDQVVYKVSWHNGTSVALNNLSFRLFYPTGTIVLDADGKPTTPDSLGFTIDSVAPGQTDSKELPVYLVGDKGEIKTARVHLSYQAGTLRSSFEKDASVATTITDLPVTLNLVAPPTATSGSSVQYILDVRNDTTDTLSDLKLQLTYPDGFTVQSVQPQPDQGNALWNIASLKAGAGTRFTITGTLSGNEQESKTITAALQHNLNGQYVDYVRTDAFTVISSPLLSVSLSPNGSRDYVSFVGDSLRYSVHYQNNSRYTFLGVLLGVRLDGDMYDTSKIKVDNGTFDDGTHQVLYDSAGVPNFASLPPGASGTLTFTVPLKTAFPSGGGTSSFFVKASATLATPNVPSGLDQGQVAAFDSLITKISTQPTLQAAVLYDNGMGSGPLPPTVGSVTTFTIQWSLINPGNDVRGAKVTALLPPGVTWVGNASGANTPTYNKNNSTVTWDVGTIPFGTGTGLPPMQATFQVSITPSTNQIGQGASLVSQATLTGADSFTNQPVQVGLHDYGTNNIQNHASDGHVVAP